jgi:hypothetical protein
MKFPQFCTSQSVEPEVPTLANPVVSMAEETLEAPQE